MRAGAGTPAMIISHASWNQDGVGEDDIVVPQQNQIAVYTNSRNEVVIRQHGWPDDDTIILVARENAKRLADAILRCAAEISGNADDEPAHRRAPISAAERKRRQCERERGGCHAANVTERDIVRYMLDLSFAHPLNREDEEAVAR